MEFNQYKNLQLLLGYLDKDFKLPNLAGKSIVSRKFLKIKQKLCALRTSITALFNNNSRILIRGSFLYNNGNKLCIENAYVLKYIFKNILTREPFVVVKNKSYHNRLHDIFKSFNGVIKRVPSITDTLIFSADDKNCNPVIIHLSFTDTGKIAIANHKNGIQLAKAKFLQAGIPELIADKIYYADNYEYSILIQKRLSGTLCPEKSLSDEDVRRYLDASLIPLVELFNNTAELNGNPDNYLIHVIYPSLINKFHSYKNTLLPILEVLQTWDDRKNIPAVLTHGDYKFKNILFNKNYEITGIIDWEVCREKGLPGYDALQILINTYSSRRRIPVTRVIEEIWHDENSDSFFISHIHSIKKLFGLNDDIIFYLTLIIWFEYLYWLSQINTNKKILEQAIERPAMIVHPFLNNVK